MSLTPADIKSLAAAIREIGTDSKSQQNTSTAAVALKLPPFWQEDPTLWFTQVESTFATRGITADKTKFDYVVTALDNKAASEVKSTLLKPPTEDMYKKLKQDLIDAFDKTQEAKDAELLSLTDIGDRTPSSHWRYLQSLNSDGSTLLRALFLSHLPPDVRTIVQSQGIKDGCELAKAADRALQARDSGRPTASAVQRTNQRQRNQRRDGRNNSNNTQRDRENDSYTCFYHKRFGRSARRCQPDCRYYEQFSTSSAHLVSTEAAGNEQTDRV